MKIGIDARPLISDTPSGIGIYLADALTEFQNETENEIILYSNEPVKAEIAKKFKNVILPGKIGTLWCCFFIDKQLREDGIDVFWGTEHMLPLFARVRKVLTIHDLALLINPKWGTLKNALMQNVFLRLSVKEADCIMADSEATKKDIIRILKAQKERVRVVYPAFKEPAYKGSLRPSRKKYFLFVGSIDERKNVDTIIRAFDVFCDITKENYHLVISGAKGNAIKKVRRLVAKSSHKNKIHFTGYVSEKLKAELYASASALVFPSYYEGFGYPVLEAFYYGVPLVTTRVSSIPELAGNLAYYIDDPKDYRALAKQMVNASRDSQDKKALAERCLMFKTEGKKIYEILCDNTCI